MIFITSKLPQTAIYWTLPPGSFFGSFFKGKIEKMKVMGPFEIWNKQNVARTPLMTSTSPPPPFALFWNVTFSVPKRDTTFWVDCVDSNVPLMPKLIWSIKYKLSLSRFCNFFFVSSQAGTWNKILTDFHTLTIFKEYLKEKSFEILANHTSSKYWQNWKYWQNKRSKYWLNFKIVHELSKCCKK